MPVPKLPFHLGGGRLGALQSICTNPQLPLSGCIQGRTSCPSNCWDLNASPDAERMPAATVRLLHTPIELLWPFRVEMVPSRSCVLSISSNGVSSGVLDWLLK